MLLKIFFPYKEKNICECYQSECILKLSSHLLHRRDYEDKLKQKKKQTKKLVQNKKQNLQYLCITLNFKETN